MTPEELAEALRRTFWASYDKEAAHQEADELLLKVLEGLGYTEAAAIFRAADKWYA